MAVEIKSAAIFTVAQQTGHVNLLHHCSVNQHASANPLTRLVEPAGIVFLMNVYCSGKRTFPADLLSAILFVMAWWEEFITGGDKNKDEKNNFNTALCIDFNCNRL